MRGFVRGIRHVNEGYNLDDSLDLTPKESQDLQEEVLALERVLKNAKLIEGCLYNFAQRKDFLISDCAGCSPAKYFCATCEYKVPVNVKRVGNHFIMSSNQTTQGEIFSEPKIFDYSFQQAREQLPQVSAAEVSLPSRMTLGLMRAR